jgi:hypothetical protein
MPQTSSVILPYEPNYRGHWEEARRRRETKEWLSLREQAVASPPTAPDHEFTPEKGAA